MREFHLFSSQSIGQGIYLVTENYLPGHRCLIGVVAGSERVLVIDAGLGLAGDLREYIEGLVGREKPIFCVCTHGHTDCIGGAAFFDRVYLSRADLAANPESFDKGFCMMQLGMWTNHCAGLEENALRHPTDNSRVDFHDLHDGDRFDLGGVSVEIIAVPGHTPGSVALRILPEAGSPITFCGDAFSAELNHLHRLSRAAIAEYAESLRRLTARIGEDEPVYSARSAVRISRQVGLDIAQACDEVLAGMTGHDAPFDFGFSKPEDGKAPDIRLHLVNNNFIVYNADLL